MSPHERHPATKAEVSTPNPWPSEDIERVDAEISEAAGQIRQYYYQQLPLLRRIPELALDANGHGGWSDQLGWVYRACVYPVPFHSTAPFSDTLFIELRSGSFIKPKHSKWTPLTAAEPGRIIQFGEDNNWYMAGDKEIYAQLAHQDEKRFVPADEVEYLQAKINDPYLIGGEELKNALKAKEQDRRKLGEQMDNFSFEDAFLTLREQGFTL